ncbi:hypothetical protein FB451DRAFT_1395585 [Mycena latifolia]|nr:hypothetical protein FB451DRAFT_1395585 [Mycena latifolia]
MRLGPDDLLTSPVLSQLKKYTDIYETLNMVLSLPTLTHLVSDADIDKIFSVFRAITRLFIDISLPLNFDREGDDCKFLAIF